MRDALAFLHTAQVHVATFERLLGEQAPGLRARHVVRADLLANARAVGAGDAALAARVHAAMREAASGGATVVVCTCSTLGGVAQNTPSDGAFTALRIDRAMADRAVRKGPRMLLVAALQSTLAPTAALLHEAAADAGVPVDLRPLLVAHAWPHFEAGDITGYVDILAKAIRGAAATADVVVLAQASMTPVATALEGLGIEVLSSPALGVAHAVALVTTQPPT